MSIMRKIIYVHPEENIAYLIDKIEHTVEDVIYMVADLHPAFFSDAINMKILSREIKGLGKNIVIVSLDAKIIMEAKNAGMDYVKMSMDELEVSERTNDSVPSASFKEDRAPQEKKENTFSYSKMNNDNAFLFTKKVIQENHSIDKESTTPPLQKKRFITGKRVIIFLIVFSLVLLSTLYILAPVISVTLVPRKETIEFMLPISTNPHLSAIDIDTSTIPGKSITINQEISVSVIASKTNMSNQKAFGELTVYNTFSSEPQKLIVNTRFLSLEGKLFRLKEGIVVPGAVMKAGKVVTPGSVSATVIADQEGSAYQIEPTRFTIPGLVGTPQYASFYAVSKNKMRGGGEKGGFVITTSDKEKAKKDLIEKADMYKESYIKEHISPPLLALKAGNIQEISDMTVSALDATGHFEATVKVTYTFSLFSEDDVHTLIDNHISQKTLYITSDSTKLICHYVYSSNLVSTEEYTQCYCEGEWSCCRKNK